MSFDKVDENTVIVDGWLKIERIMDSHNKNGSIIINEIKRDNRLVDIIPTDEFMEIAEYLSGDRENFLYTPHSNEYGDPLYTYDGWARIFEYKGETGNVLMGKKLAVDAKRDGFLMSEDEAFNFYTLASKER